MLDGDISIPATESSYKGYQNITVFSGEVTADSEHNGITVPKGGYISTTKTGQSILNADGNAAHDIIIREKTPTVSFEIIGHGAAINEQVLAYGEKAVEPAEPAEEHYFFGAWFTDKE